MDSDFHAHGLTSPGVSMFQFSDLAASWTPGALLSRADVTRLGQVRIVPSDRDPYGQPVNHRSMCAVTVMTFTRNSGTVALPPSWV